MADTTPSYLDYGANQKPEANTIIKTILNISSLCHVMVPQNNLAVTSRWFVIISFVVTSYYITDLLTRVVRVVTGVEVVSWSQERGISVSTAIAIVQRMTEWDLHVKVLRRAPRPLRIKYFFHNLLTCTTNIYMQDQLVQGFLTVKRKQGGPLRGALTG